MKNHIFFIVLLIGLVSVSQAQPKNKQQEEKAIAIGIKGGLNVPRMYYYDNEALQQLPQTYNFTPMGGLFVDIPMGKILALAPEVVYLQRGTDISYEHRSGMQVHYIMAVKYVDFRLPLELRLPIKPFFQPYLALGAEAGMRLGGLIHIDRTTPVELDKTIDVGDANMSLIHAGAFAGLGIRSRIGLGRRHLLLKLSATVHQGLVDTYSAKEKIVDETEGNVPAVNVNAYRVTGTRLPQGLEVTLGVAIPLEKVPDDACSTFAKDRHRRHGSSRHLFGY